MLFCQLLFSSFQNELFFSKNPVMNTIKVSNGLDPDQVRRFVRPDLGPNCLQLLSADDTSEHRVKSLLFPIV